MPCKFCFRKSIDAILHPEAKSLSLENPSARTQILSIFIILADISLLIDYLWEIRGNFSVSGFLGNLPLLILVQQREPHPPVLQLRPQLELLLNNQLTTLLNGQLLDLRG